MPAGASAVVMLVVTLGGIFVVSALIGVLSSGLESKLDELRKGRSQRAGERPHHHPQLVALDLRHHLRAGHRQRQPQAAAHRHHGQQGQGGDGGRDRRQGADLRNTRIICRSGDPTDLYDLGIVNPQTSRSIIVLSPEGDDPDIAGDQDRAGAGQRSRPPRRALSHRRRNPRQQERRGRPRRRRQRGAAGAGRRPDLAASSCIRAARRA